MDTILLHIHYSVRSIEKETKASFTNHGSLQQIVLIMTSVSSFSFSLTNQEVLLLVLFKFGVWSIRSLYFTEFGCKVHALLSEGKKRYEILRGKKI